MGFRAVGFVAVAALVAGPLLAEKAYIPASDGAAPGGARYRTEISVVNAKGARAATVLARIGYEAGGASAAQSVTVGGGKSLRLSGLAGNGLVELDLAKGVEAEAWLVVERPGGKSNRAWLPALNSADHMPAGTTASLDNVSLPEDYRKISVGAVNLSSRAMRCEARFQSSEGKQLAAPIGFTVAPHSERRAGSFAGARGRTDVDTLNRLRCDQPFWTYAVAEQPKTGNVELIYPAKEVVLAPTAMTSVTAAATAPLNYKIAGQFFVASSAKWAYRFTMYFGTTKTFRQVFTDFDFYHGGWDPKKPDGIHLIGWMQYNGWSSMLKYFNATKKQTKYRWIFKPKNTIGGTTPIFRPGESYHAHMYWDGVLHRAGFKSTKNGLPYSAKFNTLGASSWSYSKLFIEFGHSRNGPHGPEARSPGWKWSNLDIDLIP